MHSNFMSNGHNRLHHLHTQWSTQMHFSLQPLQWLELFFFCIQRQHAERQDFRCYKWINFKDVSENVSEAEVF